DPVTASIINTTLVIKRDATGNTDISIDDDSDNILQNMGFWDGASVFTNELQASQDLAATINNVPVTGAVNTGLTSIINGVTLNFKSEGTSTLNVERDIDTIQTAFEDFVDSYNAAIELAEEQTKVSLSGSGDEISDVGVLQGDQAVNSLRFNTRRLITSSLVDPAISNGFNTLQDIGIWTEGEGNRLSILSADKLKDALENNFDDVEDLVRDFNNGVLRNFEDFTDEVRSPVDGTIARRQTSLRNSIQDKEERINDINLLILDKEAELFQHFAQMESAVASINSQGSFLSQLQ
ncbi:MAG: flagellar filament capping protein FliD, partial [Lentisphaeraceae bacterium]|nr:flagellar filament capping protein FliD [Lentisphaeraceae bacterium]